MDTTVETVVENHKCYGLMKKTLLQFLVLISIFSSLCSYFSGFQFFFSYNLHLSTLVVPLFVRALDRKYMFIICNAILAFLAKNLKLSSSGGFTKSPEDGAKPIAELPPILEEATVEYSGSPPGDGAVEEDEQTAQQESNGAEEMKIESVVIESEVWEDEEEVDGDEMKQDRAPDSSSSMEEINDASVSTEELNKKFEEFITKMKEEIRIEAQQPLIAV